MIDFSTFMQRSALKPEAGERAYARAQVREVWDGDKFIQHLADHNGVFSRGTVKGVVSDLCNCLVEQVLNGNKVYLGELGCFYISLGCESAESLSSFTAANIKTVNLVFTPGKDFENMISKATFNAVTSRAVQTATLKAVKEQAATVNLEAIKNGSSSSGTGSGSSSGTGSDSGSGSESGDGGQDFNPLS